ncbi:MAG: hypothetical protein WBA89_03910 [Microcoleus sp.]|uniref:hypothetical protein n=1 Tax=Microcoleus sp. TaxID=44472 RepID=UPI003C73828C
MSYALQVGGELSDNYYDRLIDNYDGSDRPRFSFYLVEAKLAIASLILCEGDRLVSFNCKAFKLLVAFFACLFGGGAPIEAEALWRCPIATFPNFNLKPS